MFILDIFRVMFWSASLYIPLFFLCVIIINFWHWKPEEVRWKRSEFVGSSALTIKEHTQSHVQALSHNYVNVQKKLKLHISFMCTVPMLPNNQFRFCFHTNIRTLCCNAIPVSRTLVCSVLLWVSLKNFRV